MSEAELSDSTVVRERAEQVESAELKERAVGRESTESKERAGEAESTEMKERAEEAESTERSERPFHLGGYIEGGDPASWYPALWDWLVATQGVRCVLDVGCGEGHAVEYFADLGCTPRGVDGVPQNDERIAEHDFTTGAWHPLPGWRVKGVDLFDLVWSSEFVEHVEERYLPNLLDAFKLAPLVLMTHALPGQIGHHHVNCQSRDYWVGVLASIGYRLDEDLTDRTRELAGHNTHPLNYYVKSGLAFRRYT